MLWIHIPDLRIEIDGVIFSYYLFLFSVSYKEGSKVFFAPGGLFPLRFLLVHLDDRTEPLNSARYPLCSSFSAGRRRLAFRLPVLILLLLDTQTPIALPIAWYTSLATTHILYPVL